MFIFNEVWSAGETLANNFNKGDLLQIRLSYTGKEFVTDLLVKAKKGLYETSIELPLNVLKVEWQVLKNFEPIKRVLNKHFSLIKKEKE